MTDDILDVERTLETECLLLLSTGTHCGCSSLVDWCGISSDGDVFMWFNARATPSPRHQFQRFGCWSVGEQGS